MSTARTGGTAQGAGRAVPPAKIPIDKCFVAGWTFLFTRLHRLLPQIWLPALALFLTSKDSLVSSTLKACTLGSCKLPPILGVTGFEILMYALIGASAYTVAFGRFDRWTLARFEIGAGEIRYFLAKVIFTMVFYGLLIGAALFAVKIVGFLVIRDVLASGNPAITNADWLKNLGPVGWAAIFSPLIFAGLMMSWFGARFALVFPAACAEGRFAFLDAMALTRRNTWHIIGLVGLLGLSLLIVFGIVWWQLGLPMDAGAATAPPASTNPFNMNSLPVPAAVSKTPKWLMPLVMVAMGTAWQIVFAGALTRAYKAVKPGEE